jgi:TIR domain
MGNTVENSAERPKIFISYARADGSALAEELVTGLELTGFEPSLDRHNIAAAEDWEARLGALIQSADTVVFILSPAAIRSERCAWEVERAAELGKRLIPVQGKAVPGAEVPERLRRLNYIFFHEGQCNLKPLTELATALRQDVEWIREHTRLTEAAARWQARSHVGGAAGDLLLRGNDLTDAAAWAARRKENAPEITGLQRSYLAASEAYAASLAEAERKRLDERERLIAETEVAQRARRRVQRRSFVLLTGLLVLVVLGTGTGLLLVFKGWQTQMIDRSQFIAGMTDQEADGGSNVNGMLIGLEALPDETSASLRAHLMPLERLGTARARWRLAQMVLGLG